MNFYKQDGSFVIKISGMIRIGVLGAGHLGKIHIKCIKEVPALHLTGFYDPDPKVAKQVATEIGLKAYKSIEELVADNDAVDIVTPTLSHYDCAVTALRSSRHVFIEKPVTNTVDEARHLMELIKEANVTVQIGHVERFNPAFKTAQPYLSNPMFIEAHRLAAFNPRGTDVSVVLDLMIHDIDIVLSVVRSSVKRISASGVAVVSDTPDIANARIEFDNGCVANLTASRISLKAMRKARFFQRDAYISVDFLDKEVNIVRLKKVKGEPDPLALTIDLGKNKGMKQLLIDNPKAEPNNAIMEELKSFAASIDNGTPPAVGIEDGYNALWVAHQVVEKLKLTTGLISE